MIHRWQTGTTYTISSASTTRQARAPAARGPRGSIRSAPPLASLRSHHPLLLLAGAMHANDACEIHHEVIDPAAHLPPPAPRVAGHGDVMPSVNASVYSQIVALANWLETSKMASALTEALLGAPLLADLASRRVVAALPFFLWVLVMLLLATFFL